VTHDDRLVEGIVEDYATATISEAERALLDFAVKLTAEPWACLEAVVAHLRDAGWSDLTLVVGYFAPVNRIATGPGVELEHGRDKSPGTLK